MRKMIMLASLFCAMSGIAIAQSSSNGADWEAALAPKWGTQCLKGGCILSTDVLRGYSRISNPNPNDPREYVSIAVGVESGSYNTRMVTFEVDPRASQGGVIIGFVKADMPDKLQNTVTLDIKCDQVDCRTYTPLGIVQRDSGHPPVDLLNNLLNSRSVFIAYKRGGHTYDTLVNLSSFKTAYKNLLNNLK